MEKLSSESPGDFTKNFLRSASPVLAAAKTICVLRDLESGSVWNKLVESFTPIIELPYVEELKNPDGTIALDVTAPQLWDVMPDYFEHELDSDMKILLWDQLYMVTDWSKRVAFYCEMIPGVMIDQEALDYENYLMSTDFRQLYMKSSFYGTVAYYTV